MQDRFSPFQLVILPRKKLTWEGFTATAPRNSIALDGVVGGGPRFEQETNHVNFDHHDNVVREATMSTAMQVYFAIKGGMMRRFVGDKTYLPHVYVNDTDQDTSLALWLILNYEKFEGVQSIPHVNRLLALTDRWDITGGAFPMDLNEVVVRQHAWIFKPYNDLRKSGKLASASKEEMRENLEAVLDRLDSYLDGRAGKADLDTRHEILFDSHRFKIIDEIGGSDARYFLFLRGMDAYISLVATRSDGKFVYSVGRRSQYIPFPVEKLYKDFNDAEGLDKTNGWNGSDVVGGSSRMLGSRLTWQELRDITVERLKLEGFSMLR